ncbi:MAG: 4Fe-4S dicluster domain-containing protein [Thermoprotei archaeon]|nr:4Fe-4S dicluster domain-containing protein [Thermoprotei archaeon]
MRIAFVWDSRRCIGCMACVIACASANHPELMREAKPNPQWNWLGGNIRVVTRETGGRPVLRLVSCQHCENPPCVHACPTGASYIDKRTGFVSIDYNKCVGCKACVVACPYGARWLHPVNMLPGKCPGDFCYENKIAVCAEVCPAGARITGDLDDPNSPVNEALRKHKTERMLEHLGTEPKWFIITG